MIKQERLPHQPRSPASPANGSATHYVLKTGDVAVSSNNNLILTIAQPATVWLNLVSLFPPTYHGRPGGNRVDIMNLLAAMQPKFLRFPGGNYLEGDHIAERFDWKKTIGPWVDRPTHIEPVALSFV